MKPANQLLFATRFCFACALGLFATNGSVPLAQALEEIEKQATRILQSKCFACHNDDRAEGGYSIQNGHALYRPGDSNALPIMNGNAMGSEIWRRISSNDAAIRMPSDSAPLLESEQFLLKRWIEETPAWNSFKDQSLLERASPDQLLRLEAATPEREAYNGRNPALIATFSENRERIYVTGWGELLVWDTETATLESRWTGFEKRFAAIDLSKDERWLAVSSGQPGVSGNVYLIDLDRPVQAVRVWTASDLPPALRFSPNSRTLAIGSMTGQFVLVDVLTQTIVKEELAHADQILAVEWSSDSSHWITGSRDRTARISEFPSGELKVALGGHERSVCGVGFTPVGPITRDETGALRLWSDDDAGRVLAKRNDLPPRLQPVFVFDDRVHWATDAQWVTVIPSKMVVEDKDEKGNSKTKTNYAFQKQDAFDLPEDFESLHRLNGHDWIGLLTKTGQLHLKKEDEPSEIILRKLFP